ncbi:MAG: polysaccharide deacetylase family protein [Ginsengibacter sp.]
METGNFVISLDFELLWGVRDKVGIAQYGEHIKGVHKVIPRLLENFNEYHVKATFAIVGFLFFETKSELLNNLPDRLPCYIDKSLSPYTGHFDIVGDNFETDLYHFAPRQIRLIQKYPEHEIGSHTFSHYYCLEKGQTIEDFKSDILNAQRVAGKFGIKLTSLVFPRNQYNDEYLSVCKEMGLTCCRGNEISWIYKALNAESESLFRRAIRLIDAYINISGHNCYAIDSLKSKYTINIPSSRFLRPYTIKLKALEKLRLNRIKSGMTYAAKNNRTYHLWWHPHNFGINQDENFAFLEKILLHYKILNREYGFQSRTMSELAKQIL